MIYLPFTNTDVARSISEFGEILASYPRLTDVQAQEIKDALEE